MIAKFEKYVLDTERFTSEQVVAKCEERLDKGKLKNS